MIKKKNNKKQIAQEVEKERNDILNTVSKKKNI